MSIDVNLNFKNLSNSDLISSLENLVRSKRKITHQVLIHINEVDSRKLYTGLGYGSLFDYLVKNLSYSESAAYRRIQAARLLATVPEVAEKLESGALNLSQLTQVQKCLKTEKKSRQAIDKTKVKEILASLENKSGFESERILAQEFNQPVKSVEVVKPQQNNSVRMELVFSKEDFELLKEVQSLLSHIAHDGSWNSLIIAMAKKCRKEKLGKESKQKSQTPAAMELNQSDSLALGGTATINSDDIKPRPCRPHISIKIKRKLLAQAQHRCEFTNHETGQRCSSRHRLEIDHIHPLAFGGSDKAANLRILCRAHNNSRN